MKAYTSYKINGKIGICDERWDRIPREKIDTVRDDYFPSPYDTYFAMVHSDDGITIKMSTNEWPLRACNTTRNSNVCDDSCMEFFLAPSAAEIKYVNIEINAMGVSMFGVGDGRYGRKLIDIKLTDIKIQTLITPEEGWDAFVFIPYSFLSENFASIDTNMKANAYKIGNFTVRKHYSTWSEIKAEKLDFHLPEFFASITLSSEVIS